MKPKSSLGFTATPQRSKRAEALTLWDEEIFRHGVTDAMRDGVIVPFELVHWSGGKDVSVDDALCEMLHEVVEKGPGIIDARSVSDAEEFCAKLNHKGFVAGFVHCKLSEDEITRRLKSLEKGEIQILVHVSLLKEGVNLPFLRWMALRRNVSSKVYFAQHVGRVLRAYPGKEKAYILDPLDLFGRHKLDLEAILQCESKESDSQEGAENSMFTTQKAHTGCLVQVEEKKAVVFETGLSALRKACVDLEMEGFATAFRLHNGWRDKPATFFQMKSLESWANSEGMRECLQNEPEILPMLRQLYRDRSRLNSGQISDFISVLSGFWEKYRAQMELFAKA